MVVAGAAGLGKSRLLAEGAAIAEAAVVRVAPGRANEIGALIPLAPLLSALSSGPSPLLQRAELRALERPGDQRFWLLEELAEMIEVRSRDAPVLVIIDDLQWSDTATLAAIQSLSQRLISSPVGWLLAVRSDGDTPAVRRLLTQLAEAGATRVDLRPLRPPEVAVLAAQLTGGAPDAALLSFVDGAGGNPFLAIDLLEALVAEDAVVVQAGVSSLASPAVPQRFRAGVRDRIGSLSLAAQHFLQAGSVFGRSFTLNDVATVLGSQPGALVPIVNETMGATVLTDEAGRLEFRHDLIRQAISADIPPSTRVVLHRTAATAILGRNGPAAEAAAHLLQSAEPGDREAITALQRAASETAGQAPRVAAELAIRAIELMTPGEPGWPEAIAGAVRLAAWASRFSEAVDLATRALGLDLDPDEKGLVRLGLSDALMLGGRRRDVIVHARDALARPDLPHRLRCTFLHNLAFALAMDGDVAGASQAYDRAIASAGPHDDGVILACRIGIAFVEGSRGHLAEALALGEECARVAAAGGPELRQRFPQAWLASALSAMDRFDDADAVLAAYRAEAEEFGASWALEFCERSACISRMMAGRIDEAVADAEADLALIESLDMWNDSDVPLGVLALVAFHGNDLEAADAIMSRSQRYRDLYGRGLPAYLTRAEALLRDARGDALGAVEHLREVFDGDELRTQHLALEPSLAPELVRLALRAGEVSRAQTVAGTADELARANAAVGTFSAAAEQCLGLVTGDAAHLVAAAEQFRASPRIIARASAFEDAGRALLEQGYELDGARYLNEAIDALAGTAARRDKARVRRRLRDAGVRRSPPRQDDGDRPLTGWDSVSSAELRVVRLVAEGLTNREIAGRLFISAWTVGTHLKHVFAKLGVASRVELTRVTVERGLAS
jgi:DNA-binding CsgD family transcriptional regulator/tetratricopeptide (TPR) repeat protein